MLIPVYLFTGFMDSGKTTLIRETLLEEGFSEEGPTLLVVCEDGEEEYSTKKMAEADVTVVMVGEDHLTSDFLKREIEKNHPNQIFIEYNGTWEVGGFLEDLLPDSCELIQNLATVDGSTYENYLANMRPMVMEQLFIADVVIFNRCDEKTDKGKFRRSVKAQNRKAQIVYERKDGSIDEEPEELPFDLTQEFLEISDMDYGIWYLDALDHPKAYEGKKVRFLGLIYNPEKLKKGVFIPGRFAMTCCVEDVSFIGFKCKSSLEMEPQHKSWAYITAEIKVEFAKEYKGKGPVLYLEKIESAEKPEEDLVYFN
ncbi:MAG: GTP-binding protein [Lachnospiraceae bacterium]